jgi:gluconate 5-dehydrogenase
MAAAEPVISASSPTMPEFRARRALPDHEARPGYLGRMMRRLPRGDKRIYVLALGPARRPLGDTVPSHLFDLTGRTALVTGGGSGLGLAIAEGLAAAGARVVLVGRDIAKLHAASERMRGTGAQAGYVACNLLDGSAVAALVEEVKADHGPVDILVNNAGIQHRAAFVEFPRASWDQIIATHLSAPFSLCQAIVPDMIARGHGKIINTLSVMSELGRPTIVPYTAAKGGLKMLTRGLAAELGLHNIQVNGIGPGYFRTELNRALFENPEFDSWVKKRTPAGRWGEPDELVGTAVFLASKASDFVTGQIVFVDGGLTASV